MSSDLWMLYQQQQQTRLQIFNQIDIAQEEGYLMRLAFFSANLINLYPHISPNYHPEIFQKNLSFTALETADRTIPYLADISTLTGNTAQLTSLNKTFIFCSVHLGSYRLLATWLFEQGYNLSILVRSHVYEQELASIMDFKNRMCNTYNLTNDAQVIDAEQPTSLLKILRQIKAGYSLIIYLDANTGSGNKQGIPINFLNQQLSVREGAPILSYLSNTPIIPVISYRRQDLHNILHFGDAILPNQSINREEFSKNTLQDIYDWFTKFLIKYPEQWEALNYIHNLLLVSPPTPPSTFSNSMSSSVYHFNEQRYMLLDFKDEPLLFDRYTYSCQEISFDLLDYLQQKTFTTPWNIIGESLFDELIQNQVIIH